MTALLILTLLTGEVLTIRAPLEGCKAVEAGWKQYGNKHIIVDGRVLDLARVECRLEI